MAVARIHSCLSGPPTNAAPPTSGSRLVISPWSPGFKTACKEGSWRDRCVSTVACVILGSAVGFAEVGAGWEDLAYAGEMREAEGAAASRPGKSRWSEKRECPPWRNNSLENVVPENLPRAPARRRLDSVSISRRAPAVFSSSCFTL